MIENLLVNKDLQHNCMLHRDSYRRGKKEIFHRGTQNMETFSGVVFNDTLKFIIRQSNQSAFVLAWKFPGECDRTKLISFLIFKN